VSEDDWDDFGGEPPGQYIVFSDTLGTLLEVTLTLAEGTPGRAVVLRRALAFGEAMLAGASRAVHDLAIDAVAETLDGHPAGVAAAGRFGGPRLNTWFATHSEPDWPRPPHAEIIDLWGVRDELSALLPGIALQAIPGISHPAKYHALASLDVARAAADGMVLLSAFGTTTPYVVARAAGVTAGRETLAHAARDIAVLLGEEEREAAPGLELRRIPLGERVWNMARGPEPHGRVTDEPWVAAVLEAHRDEILDLLAGRIARLRFAGAG